MIIACTFCQKKFEVAESLIPEKGRLLKCGSCDQTWYFNKNNQINTNTIDTISPTKKKRNKPSKKSSKKTDESIDQNTSRILVEKPSNNIKDHTGSIFTFSKFLSFILVTMVSFTALIIILDTFKSPLYKFYPNLELLLFSLYEVLKDIELFVKDLI